jgi:RNA-binding protein NOB1
MATNTSKPVHSLVLDTGSIIKNEPSVSTLLSQAETLFTIPAVIEEIRDAATRSRVESTLLPFLKLRSPRPASIKVITDFARRTGDLEVLSRPDIHLMALTYELECERNHGDWRLRSVPGQKELNGISPASLSGDDAPREEVPGEEKNTDVAPVPAPETRGAWGTTILKEGISQATEGNTWEAAVASMQDASGAWIIEIPKKGPSVAAAGIESALKNTHIASTEMQQTLESTPETQQKARTEDISAEEVTESDSEGSDGEGWITPSNIKKHQEKHTNGSVNPEKENKTMQVAIITTDFAMQNVLLRMNLNLLTPSLMRIKQLKTWVLRCHGCFYITKDMTKQFCTRCGKPTLLRTSCSTDKDGNFKVHLKKNMQWNTRGNIYSIPKPVAGSSNTKRIVGGGKGGWGQELILAEDQKEYVNALTGARRKKDKDLMDEDYLPSILSGDRGRAGGRPKVGAGKNVNSRKRK